MKTRDKILNKARELFNNEGLKAVSSRRISDELKISYGNLCYHFPKKDDLILALYFDMQAELSEEVANLQDEIYHFDFMIKSLKRMLEVLYKYKFIFLDFTDICRRFEEVRINAVRQYENRKLICRSIYAFLIAEGHLKEEKRPGHYDNLVTNILMILNVWIVDAEIYYSGPKEEVVNHYLELIYTFVSASLTKKGAEAFLQVYEGEVREQQ